MYVTKLKSRSLILLLVTTISLTGQAHAEALKVGWIGPLSGNAAILGIDSAEALKLAVKKHNETKEPHTRAIELYLEDDQYKTANTIRSYNYLVHSKGTKVIFVLTYGGLFAVSPLAEKDNVLLIDPLDCNNDIAELPENTFCISQLTENLGQENADYAASNHDSSAGIIYFANDPFMGVLAASTKKRLLEHNIKVPLMESYEASTPDFKTLLLKAKQKNIKALFFYGYDEIGAAIREGKAIGLTATFYAVGTVTSPGLLKNAGPAAEHTRVAVWQPEKTAAYSAFLADFRKQTGRERPNFEISSIPAYDLGQILSRFLTSTKPSTINVATLRNYLYELREYQGVSGTITMSPDGAARTLPVSRWVLENGELVRNSNESLF